MDQALINQFKRVVDGDDALVRYSNSHFKRIINPFTLVPDGIEALNTLRGKGGYDPIPRPYLILLNINMPRVNGIEFLRELRQDPELKRSIVFI